MSPRRIEDTSSERVDLFCGTSTDPQLTSVSCTADVATSGHVAGSVTAGSLFGKGAITSKIKYAVKHKTSPARLAQLLQPSLALALALVVLDGTPSLAAS